MVAADRRQFHHPVDEAAAAQLRGWSPGPDRQRRFGRDEPPATGDVEEIIVGHDPMRRPFDGREDRPDLVHRRHVDNVDRQVRGGKPNGLQQQLTNQDRHEVAHRTIRLIMAVEDHVHRHDACGGQPGAFVAGDPALGAGHRVAVLPRSVEVVILARRDAVAVGAGLVGGDEHRDQGALVDPHGGRRLIGRFDDVRSTEDQRGQHPLGDRLEAAHPSGVAATAHVLDGLSKRWISAEVAAEAIQWPGAVRDTVAGEVEAGDPVPEDVFAGQFAVEAAESTRRHRGVRPSKRESPHRAGCGEDRCHRLRGS